MVEHYHILVVMLSEGAVPSVSCDCSRSRPDSHVHVSSDYNVWTRGSKDDYNRLASVSGDNGWSWNSLIPYFQKVRMLPPCDLAF